MMSHDGMVLQGTEDGDRVGKPRSFDDNTTKIRHFATSRACLQIHKSFSQIGADGTANAAICQHDNFANDTPDEEVIERNLTKFIDDDGRITERGVEQKSVEMGCLPAAKKPGKNVHDNW